MASGAPPLEIERRFLVSGAWPEAESVRLLRQCYVSAAGPATVRLREDDGRYFLTIKEPLAAAVRAEFEFPVPVDTARAMMAHFGPRSLVEKHRHVVTVAGRRWEIDVFQGRNLGLVLAEVELARADEPLDLPPWIGREVTHDARFTNHALSLNPFGNWGISYQTLDPSSIRSAQ
jgi:adenylate cyclase